MDIRFKLRRHLLKRGVYVGRRTSRITVSELLFKVIQEEEQHQWTNEDIVATIKELAEPLATRTLRDRLNHTRDGLSGQPTAIVVIPPRSNTQTLPGSAAPPVIPIAAPPATPIAAPASTSTLPGPPPARYLYPSTARDRLNHTLNGLAIGPESV